MFVTSFRFRFFGSPQDAKLKIVVSLRCFSFSLALFVSKRKIFCAVLWNCNFLRFRFRFWLLASFGSGSGSKPNNIKSKFFTNNFGKNLAFLHIKLFYKEKIYEVHNIFCKFKFMVFIESKKTHIINCITLQYLFFFLLWVCFFFFLPDSHIL